MEYDSPTEIRERFNQKADTYVAEVSSTIPNYEETLNQMAQLLNLIPTRPLRILDLGSGPGFLAKRIAEEIGDVDITLVDFADKMLAKALTVLKSMNMKVQPVCFDFRDFDYGENDYDAVVSSFALHHLRPGEKPVIYPKIFKTIKPGGLFINFDQLIEPDPIWEAFLRDEWAKFILGIGWTEEQIVEMYEEIFEGEDSPETLENEFILLRKAGFNAVSLLFRKHLFGLVVARKQ